MATTTPLAFLQAKKTDIAALTDSGPLAFARVELVPSIDPDEMSKIPRWPVAFITDQGGAFESDNGKFWRGVFSVVVGTVKPRDPWGAAAMEEVIRLGELLVGLLEYTRDDNEMFLVADSATAGVKTDQGLVIVMKEYTFTYMIQRA